MDKLGREKRYQEVLRLYNLGVPYSQIAKEVGLSKSGVHNIIHKFNIKINVQSDTSVIMTEKRDHKYEFKTYNGRVKIYVDGYVMFCFNQIDFAGYYAYKDDRNLYGLDIYMNREKAGQCQMEIYFKTKENWMGVLRLLDENM